MNTDFPGGSPQPGARCVTHPDNLAGGTCTRCGNFLCYVDTEGGRFSTCESCRARTGMTFAFPLNRANYNFGSLWDHCWSVFKVHWLMLSVGALIPIVALFVLSLMSNLLQLPLMFAGRGGDGELDTGLAVGTMALSFGFIFVIYLVMFALVVGYLRMCQDVLDGGQPDIGRMFSQFGKFGRIVLAFLILMVGGYLTVAIAIAPGVGIGFLLYENNRDLAFLAGWSVGLIGYFASFFVLIPFYLLPAEIAWTEVGVVQTIVNCWNTASEFRWSLVLVALVSIPISLLGLLACCIGIIPAYAFIGLLFAGAHRAIRNGAYGVTPQP